MKALTHVYIAITGRRTAVLAVVGFLLIAALVLAGVDADSASAKTVGRSWA